MTTSSKPKASPERLYWIKYNPNEWNGMYPELSDEEYGLFHRVITKLWSTPGNRLTEGALLIELRAKAGSKRAKLLHGLIGYALKVDEDGSLFVRAIDDAFEDASKRGTAASAGAAARWAMRKPAEAAPLKAAPSLDF